MTPMFGVKVDENTCDIRYNFSGYYDGTDHRRFRYGTGCNKTVVSMGRAQSGTSAA
jgi:hypothetical protein